MVNRIFRCFSRIVGLLLGMFVGLSSVTALAQERVALVIGNSIYDKVVTLDNPARDANLIADTLESAGFKVTRLINATQADMKRGITLFGRSLRDAGPDATGLFFYAGHGVQSFGANYLLPVDVSLQDAADLDLQGVEAQAVLRQMYSARNQTNIVILDACRNNPFQNIPEFDEPGLAEMKAPTGTFLAYATEPGGVALDGIEDNSPFTAALARKMLTPGLPLEQMFKQVRIDVLEATGNRQTPWDTSSLTADFAFVPAEPTSAADLAEQQFWNAVKATRDPVQVMLFLRAYPGSRFETDARALLAAVMQDELDGNPVVTPPTAAGPSAAEQAAFEAAQVQGTVAAYRAYLDNYPSGTFAEFATGEIASLESRSGTDPVGEGVTPPTPPAPPAPDPVVAATVTFEAPLQQGDDAIRGKSLVELITGSPLFPPFEGLPEELWKGQTCSNCHEWKRENLCEQGKTYLSASAERSLNKQHPYGGTFKSNLRSWAENQCR